MNKNNHPLFSNLLDLLDLEEPPAGFSRMAHFYASVPVAA